MGLVLAAAGLFDRTKRHHSFPTMHGTFAWNADADALKQ
jgi:hypothetical protein